MNGDCGFRWMYSSCSGADDRNTSSTTTIDIQKKRVDTLVKLTVSDGKYIPKHLTISSNFRHKHTYSILLKGSLFSWGRMFIIIIRINDKTNLHSRCPCCGDWCGARDAMMFASLFPPFYAPHICGSPPSLSFRRKRAHLPLMATFILNHLVKLWSTMNRCQVRL